MTDRTALSSRNSAQTLLDKLEAARNHVCDIAAGRCRWQMSIPARPDADSDLMIAGALQEAINALEATPSEKEQNSAPLLAVLKLADELTTAIDLADEDIGGARDIKEILRELGPAVDAANESVKANRQGVADGKA